jgi:hypothetical protein
MTPAASWSLLLGLLALSSVIWLALSQASKGRRP